VLDAGYPRIMRLSTEGVALDDIGLTPDLGNPFAGGRALQPRYAVRGEVIVGPLDCGVYNQTWHKVGISARMPEGTSLLIQTYAGNEDKIDVDAVAWAPVEPVPVTGSEATGWGGRYERLVLSDTQVWERCRHGEYTRAKPEIHAFSGDGPSSGNTFRLILEEARILHVGDTVVFDTGLAAEEVKIHGLSATAMRAYANGVARLYPAGTEIWLVERNGRPVAGGERLLHTLESSDAIDLSSAVMADRLIDVALSHPIGAVARSGDRIELRAGDDAASLEVESVEARQEVDVTINVPVAGDFSTSTLSLHDTPGRLVCTNLTGFEYQPPRHTMISVDGNAAAVELVEPDVATVWLAPGSGIDFPGWKHFETATPVATDRGQYLWVRLGMRGMLRHAGDETAVATPTIHSIGALTPRPGYLAMLPALYSRTDPDRDPTGGVFLERYLAMFEGRFTAMESAYEQVPALLNIESTNEEWLKFLSTWMGLVLDPSWDVVRRRQLLREVMDLYQRRGTREGLSRYLEIYTGRRPVILEGFQWRPAPSMVVGRMGHLGCSALGSCGCDFASHAHRFEIRVFVDSTTEPDVAEAAVRSIIDSVKPAHTDYDLVMKLPESRVGSQSRVGIDMILSDRPVDLIRLAHEPTRKPPHSIIGRGSLSRNSPGHSETGGLTLNQDWRSESCLH
jgi:phage tail-like protein